MNTNTVIMPMSVEQARREIEELRWWVDKCDSRMMRDMVKRNGYVEQIGERKRRAGIPVEDQNREIALLTRCLDFALAARVSHKIITVPFRAIMEVSKEVQQQGKQQISPELFKKVFG